jgi:hypothetical protein
MSLRETPRPRCAGEECVQGALASGVVGVDVRANFEDVGVVLVAERKPGQRAGAGAPVTSPGVFGWFRGLLGAGCGFVGCEPAPGADPVGLFPAVVDRGDSAASGESVLDGGATDDGAVEVRGDTVGVVVEVFAHGPGPFGTALPNLLGDRRPWKPNIGSTIAPPWFLSGVGASQQDGAISAVGWRRFRRWRRSSSCTWGVPSRAESEPRSVPKAACRQPPWRRGRTRRSQGEGLWRGPSGPPCDLRTAGSSVSQRRQGSRTSGARPAGPGSRSAFGSGACAERACTRQRACTPWRVWPRSQGR